MRDRLIAPARWLCLALPLALAACSSALLDPRGSVGVAEKTILIDSLAIMLAIVVPTIIATLGFAWWYRASNLRARHLPDWSFSGRIELVVWAIPVMVIILLGGVTWIGAHPARPGPEARLEGGAARHPGRSRSTGSGSSSIRARASPRSTSSSCRPACRFISR